MNKIILILLLAASVAWSTVDASKSLCLQTRQSSGDSIFTLAPYGINEFDFDSINGTCYLLYNTYAGGVSESYLKTASTIRGLFSAPVIHLKDIGADSGLAVPNFEYDENSGVWWLVAAHLPSSTVRLYRSTSPATQWVRDSFYITDAVGDYSIRKSPINNKWYLSAEESGVSEFNTYGPKIRIYQSDSANGHYTNLGDINTTGQMQSWWKGEYDAQIEFYNGRKYVMFAAVNVNAGVNVGTTNTNKAAIVELNNNFKIIGKPVIMQKNDQVWMSITSYAPLRPIANPVLYTRGSTPKIFYDIHSFTARAGWGYTDFKNNDAKFTNIPKGTTFCYKLSVDSLSPVAIDGFYYDMDLTSLITDGKINNVNSSNLCVVDSLGNIKKSHIIKKDSLLYVRFIDTAKASNVYYLCGGSSISNSKNDTLIPFNLIYSTDSIYNDVTGRKSSSNTLTLEKGLFDMTAISTQSTIMTIQDSSIRNKTACSVEFIVNPTNLTTYQGIMYFGTVTDSGILGFDINANTLLWVLYSPALSYFTSENISSYIKLNNPMHIVFTFNGGSPRLYLNGRLLTGTVIGSVPSVLPKTNNVMTVSITNPNGLRGRNSFTRVYNKTLDSNYIVARYRQLLTNPVYTDAVSIKKSTGNNKPRVSVDLGL